MSSTINANWEQSLHDEVNRLVLAAFHTFHLFRTYSIRSSDSTVARNELKVAAHQTKTRCDKLLARVPFRPELRLSLLAISEKLEFFSQFLDTYSKDVPLPQEEFIEFRTRVGNVQSFYYLLFIIYYRLYKIFFMYYCRFCVSTYLNHNTVCR